MKKSIVWVSELKGIKVNKKIRAVVVDGKRKTSRLIFDTFKLNRDFAVCDTNGDYIFYVREFGLIDKRDDGFVSVGLCDGEWRTLSEDTVPIISRYYVCELSGIRLVNGLITDTYHWFTGDADVYEVAYRLLEKRVSDKRKKVERMKNELQRAIESLDKSENLLNESEKTLAEMSKQGLIRGELK